MMLCSCGKNDLLIVYPADVERVRHTNFPVSIRYQYIGILIRYVVSSPWNNRQIPITGLNDVTGNLMRPTAKDAIH
jgi:hypothetical protein